MLSSASDKESPTVEADEKPLQFDEFVSNAPTIFDAIEEHGGSVLIEWRGRLFSVRSKVKRHAKKSPRFRENDSLFKLAGAGRSAEPTDVARHKHDYLADAASNSQRNE
jgi:hypothetical protein